jgi:hypothetical protein
VAVTPVKRDLKVMLRIGILSRDLSFDSHGAVGRENRH